MQSTLELETHRGLYSGSGKISIQGKNHSGRLALPWRRMGGTAIFNVGSAFLIGVHSLGVYQVSACRERIWIKPIAMHQFSFQFLPNSDTNIWFSLHVDLAGNKKQSWFRVNMDNCVLYSAYWKFSDPFKFSKKKNLLNLHTILHSNTVKAGFWSVL